MTTQRPKAAPQHHQSRTAIDRFATCFAALEAFVEREGHAVVPGGHIEEGVKLGPWVQSRRVSYNRGRISAERAAALEALPGWRWSLRAAAEAENLAALDRFVTEHGHAEVP